MDTLYQEPLSQESPPLPKMDLLDEIDCSFASGYAGRYIGNEGVLGEVHGRCMEEVVGGGWRRLWV